MAESLGEALLTLRTDDGSFIQGVNRAKGTAEQLGGTFDKTTASTDRLGNEMAQTAKQADQMSAAVARSTTRGRENVVSTGAQRAGLQQLSFQLNDVVTMYALGARPTQIFASQIGQVTQAIQMATGGTSRLAAFLGGPWGIALTSATIVLAPFVAKLFEAEKAAEAAELGADALGRAQTVLGQIFDTTSGKLKSQNELLMLNARLTALQLRGEAAQRGGSATAVLNSAGQRGFLESAMENMGRSMAMAGGARAQRSPGAINTDTLRATVQQLRSGAITSQEAMQRSETLDFSGTQVTREQFQQALIDQAYSTSASQAADLIERSLDSGQLDPALRRDRPKGRGGRTGTQGPSAEEIDAQFEDDLVGITQRILSARQSIATDAEERADLEARQVEWDRRQSIKEIEANRDYSEAQKAELRAATDRLADAELQAIEQQKQRTLEAEAQALAEEIYRAEVEALQLQLSLADTEQARKDIALKLLAAEEKFLRQRLQAIIDSETASAAERDRARIALDAIDATSGDRRTGVERANETTLERYLRDLQKTPEQINEAIDAIAVDGLVTLENELINVMRGVSSLGDLFSSVADQIIADLLRIAIQQAVIAPLANMAFPGAGAGAGAGGGGAGFLSDLLGLFVGGRASGGPIPAGKFALVGEEGPELAFGGTDGLSILSNSDSRAALSAGGTTVTIPINIDATGADAAAVARVRSDLYQLKRDLPGLIVNTVQEADNRRVLNLGGGR